MHSKQKLLVLKSPVSIQSKKEKHIFFVITIIVLSGITLYYVSQRDVYNEPFLKKFNESLNRVKVSCHYSEEGDSLPSAEDKMFSPRPNSIFFHETSCRGGLTLRQACSIESAARAHPRKEIYVLFSGPINQNVLARSCLSVLRLFPNIRLARVHITEYAKKTPLEEMVEKKVFYQSRWWIEHTSDILRYLTLYKWGGTYLDTDMMVVKSLLPLGHNWVAKEDPMLVNAAAIAISMDHLGRKLARALMNEIRTTYRPDLWSHNGPGAITRVLKQICKTDDIAQWSPETCDGLEVYGSELIYPLHYSIGSVYFERGDLEPEIEERAYTYHLWNKITYKTKIEKDSPYAKMAEKFCPTIYGYEVNGDKLVTN